MIYAIHAMDVTYGGLHGFDSWAFVDTDTEIEARTIATEMSEDVIWDNCITALEEEVFDDMGLDYDPGMEWTDDMYARRDDLVAEDIDYDIYKILDEYSEMTVQDFDKMVQLKTDEEDIVKKYFEII